MGDRLEQRRRKEKEQRKKSILTAARRQFLKRGFNDVTVEGIAREARISKGTVYLYFKSKEEIYAHVLLSHIGKFHEQMRELGSNGANASERLHLFASAYIDFFLSNRELFRIFMNFMLQTVPFNFSDDMKRDLIHATNRTIEIVEEIFTAGLSSGEFVCTNDLKRSRNAVWGLLNGIIALHLFTGRESTCEERIRSNVREGMEILIEGFRKRIPLRTGRTNTGKEAL
ncbi:MAG TPA: TetR/AcrR family transcriptional regulator [Syntrophales bacterium]|nr:TetR/AcrR family transcriptional regulator [Syntrophales bacterium]HPX11041.1 TetR/AcrR family transcriptional regulator [Syntrophales bacterium]HQB30645.1 TetR/AcrR family transcriptional regulator [Syntrophales bacterium]HQN78493.1 TetR/AcrR family transcriptional regulator [Syntrophales bacterium]HQQ27378.1 TetR/AcrR family transcriptional regulator [Syntrophales bacterium]